MYRRIIQVQYNYRNVKNNDKVVNEHGRKLLALCKETDISIVNGRLEEGNCTFYSVNRDIISSSTIDYLITNGYNFRNVRNMRVLDVHLSDHRAISFSLCLKYKNVYVKKHVTRKCSIAAESHIRSHYHISSKIQLFW